MAAISNMRLKLPNQPDLSTVGDIPLEALPVAAAIVDSDGTILALNSGWITTHPNATLGSAALEWCDAETGKTLSVGIRAVISGENPRFVHDYGPAELPRRITVAAAGAGAILIDQDNVASADQSPGGTTTHASLGRVPGNASTPSASARAGFANTPCVPGPAKRSG